MDFRIVTIGDIGDERIIECGGHPIDPRNLWPEPYPRASAVDAIENDLNHSVCSGDLSLERAQLQESALKHSDG